MEKIRIGGIRLSRELTMLTLEGLPEAQPLLSRLCGLLAARRINMPFLALTRSRGLCGIQCCVAAEDAEAATEAVASAPDLSAGIRWAPRVCLLSLYPTRSRMSVLGRSLQAFHGADATPQGLASSRSVLTFIIPRAAVDRAISALGTYFDLPPDHAPIEPAIRVVQSRLIKPDE